MENLLTIERFEDVEVVNLHFNELSLEQREVLKDDFLNAAASGAKKFVVDFSKVGFLSSLVIATVIFFAKDVRNHGGDVKLCCFSKEAMNVVHITQLDRIFEIYDTGHDAIESFKSS